MSRQEDASRTTKPLRLLADKPTKLAYWGLLGSSTLATLSSNILNAPLGTIRAELSSTVAEIVLMVSAFTVVLTVAVPVAGWCCDRFGNRRMLLWAFALMAAADLIGFIADTVGTLVSVRAVQGLATSFIAPGVQKSLVVIWPSLRRRSLALWASALGVGQVLGPLAGGAISQTLGWRAVFLVHSLLCAIMLCLLLVTLPAVIDRTVRTHIGGLFLLAAGATGVVIGFTLFAQRTLSTPAVVSGLLGSVLLVGFVWVARQKPDALIDPPPPGRSPFCRKRGRSGGRDVCDGIIPCRHTVVPVRPAKRPTGRYRCCPMLPRDRHELGRSTGRHSVPTVDSQWGQ